MQVFKKYSSLRSLLFFWKWKLCRAGTAKFPGFFWNWTNKNIPDRQHSARVWKSQKVLYHSTLIYELYLSFLNVIFCGCPQPAVKYYWFVQTDSLSIIFRSQLFACPPPPLITDVDAHTHAHKKGPLWRWRRACPLTLSLGTVQN